MLRALLNDQVELLAVTRDEAGDISEETLGPYAACVMGANQTVVTRDGTSQLADKAVYVGPEAQISTEVEEWHLLHEGAKRRVLSIRPVRDLLHGNRLDHYKLMVA